MADYKDIGGKRGIIYPAIAAGLIVPTLIPTHQEKVLALQPCLMPF